MAELPTTKNPAIFITATATPSELLAAAALYTHLSSTIPTTSIIAPVSATTLAILKQLLPTANVLTGLPAHKFVITLPKQDSEVEMVQWEQAGDIVKIYITMATGQLQTNQLKVSAAGADYDLAILLKVNSLSELGGLEKDNPDFFKTTKLFAIGSEPDLDPEYKLSISNKPQLTTLAEQLFAVIDSPQLAAQVSQLLLAGIMLETDNLSSDVASAETLAVIKKLVERGAQFSKNAAIIAGVNQQANQPAQS